MRRGRSSSELPLRPATYYRRARRRTDWSRRCAVALLTGGSHFLARSRSESDGFLRRSSATSRSGWESSSSRPRRCRRRTASTCSWAARPARTRMAWSAFASRFERTTTVLTTPHSLDVELGAGLPSERPAAIGSDLGADAERAQQRERAPSDRRAREVEMQRNLSPAAQVEPAGEVEERGQLRQPVALALGRDRR